MINAVLIDDEEIALDLLDILLAEIGGVTVTGKFLHAADALNHMAASDVDLVFLDIEMPGMNGLYAAERLAAIHPSAQIIFVTAYHEYAVDAFDVNAMDYLLKPLSKIRLVKALERFGKRQDAHRTDAAEHPAAARTDPVMLAPLRLRVLGSLELFGAGDSLVAWRTKKVKELFAYLWHTQGEPVHRHRILADLWPDTEAVRAQQIFHTTMYHLRSLLKKLGFPNAVSFADERYVMRTDCVHSDAQTLMMRLRKPGGEPIGDMLALYRGDLLEAEAYTWAVPMRLQLRSDYVRLLERSIRAATDEEQEAIWRNLIALEPYSEMYYDEMLHLLAGRGDIAAIRKLYEELKDRLNKELGMQPSARIRSFMEKFGQ
jgi:two-component SAPR family response regulator